MMFTRISSILVAAALVAIAGCGFQPVHTTSNVGNFQASQITIPEIEGRSGHALRKALVEELAAGLAGVDSGTLTVTLDEQLNRLAIRPDQAAARTDIIVRGRYILDTGEDAISGRADAESSFNVPISAFGDIAAQTSASERAVGQLAQRIADDLRIKLADQE